MRLINSRNSCVDRVISNRKGRHLVSLNCVSLSNFDRVFLQHVLCISQLSTIRVARVFALRVFIGVKMFLYLFNYNYTIACEMQVIPRHSERLITACPVKQLCSLFLIKKGMQKSFFICSMKGLEVVSLSCSRSNYWQDKKYFDLFLTGIHKWYQKLYLR